MGELAEMVVQARKILDDGEEPLAAVRTKDDELVLATDRRLRLVGFASGPEVVDYGDISNFRQGGGGFGGANVKFSTTDRGFNIKRLISGEPDDDASVDGWVVFSLLGVVHARMLVDRFSRHFTSGEEVLAAVGHPLYEQALIATSQRLVYSATKIPDSEVFDASPYGHITSFEYKEKAMDATVGFVASGDRVTARIKGIRIDKNLERFVAVVGEHLGGSDASAARTPIERGAEGGGDIPLLIRQLKQLLDEGILTAEEFDAKKRELLDRL